MLERVDRAHRALQSFTADASHELRTPLTHLRAQVQWASEEGRSDSEIREALAAMERGLDRTTKLVEELLLIARGENRQLALAHAPFDLQAVVEEVREITEAMAMDKNLTVRAESADRATAIGDADRTRHILLNLASNAVRYTSSGSVTFATRRNGTEVGVSVHDTGPGIAPEHVDRIFDRFYRIDQSRSRELGGTGLGLAIARLFAELQGGRIEVESKLGEGVTTPESYQAINERMMSTTDPDAAMVSRGRNDSRPRYHHHRAIDDAKGVVTAVESTPGSVTENRKLLDLIEQHESNTGSRAETVVGDHKYGTQDNFVACQQRGICTHLVTPAKARITIEPRGFSLRALLFTIQ